MDTSIVNFLNRNKRRIDIIVDQTFFRLLEPISMLDRLMPQNSYVDRKLLMLKFTGKRPTLASFVGEEQEIPASRPRAELNEQLLGNLKVGKKFVYTAQHFELMNDLMRYSQESGPRGAEMKAKIEEYFIGLKSDLVAPIIEKLTVIALQIATTGQSVFTDPLTGARVDLVYPNVLTALMPAALTTTQRWSQAATCTPLANLESHARAMYDALGMWPETWVGHFANLRQVADSNEAKIAWLRKLGADSTTPDVTGVYLSDEMVMSLMMERMRCKSIELLDAQYSEEQEDGTVSDKPFLADNYYFLGAPGFMERAFVPTVEKDFAAGIYTHDKVVEEAPRRERSVALANVIPVVPDERKLAARKVA